MSTTLDLRDLSPDERRTTLFDAFDAADAGDSFDIVADDDPDPALVQYQIDRGRSLDWEHAHPDAEPRELEVVVGAALAGDRPTFDVRDLKPQRRHESLLTVFDELGAGEGFVLVNDHDPKPLYHELRSMHGEVVGWEYRREDDGEFRVAIAKTEASSADADDVVTRYDVREIPKPERHPTIHHRYGMIPAGGTMELIAPHEPRPLRREFDQRYGDAFEWTVVDSEPGRCRVRITKTEDAPAGAGADGSADETPSSERDDGHHGCSHDHGHGADHDDGDGHGADHGDEDDGEPAVGREPAAEEGLTVETELDVRDRPPAERHERIFAAYDDLDAGQGFVLVNDHDPKPLYYQFEAEAGPAFRWAYRQREPGEFRVLVGKAAVDADAEASDGDGTAAADDEGAEAPF